MKREYVEFKLSYLKSTFLTCGLTNALANGGCYYLFNSHSGNKGALDFVINAAVTAFVLSLICAAFAALSVKAKYKKGEIPEKIYTRNGHLLMHFFPRGTTGQVFASAIVVTLLFTFISGGAVVVFGCAQAGVPLMQGVVMHGILAGLMGVTNMYLMCVARVSTFEEEGNVSRANVKSAEMA